MQLYIPKRGYDHPSADLSFGPGVCQSICSFIGWSVCQSQTEISNTPKKKHAPCVARTVHVNCVLHLKMRVFMEEEERKEEEEVEEEDD